MELDFFNPSSGSLTAFPPFTRTTEQYIPDKRTGEGKLTDGNGTKLRKILRERVEKGLRNRELKEIGMERIKKILERMPGWVLTGVCLAAILWLTLASKPLGDNEMKLFPHADKVAHAIMFGGFAFCILLDWTRKRGWKRPRWGVALAAAAASTALGILTEAAQSAMHIGRSGDGWDLVADAAGAAIVALCAKSGFFLSD